MRLVRFVLASLVCVVLVLSACSGESEALILNQEVDEGKQLLIYLDEVFSGDDELSHTFSIVKGVGVIRRNQYVYLPNYGDAGERIVTIRARDSQNNVTDTTFTIIVNEVNTPPVMSVPNQVVYMGEEFRLDLLKFVSDPEGDDVSLRMVDGPGEIVDGQLFSFRPGSGDLGSHVVRVVAEDERGAYSIGSFKVRVSEPAPVEFYIADKEISRSQMFSLNLRDYLSETRVGPDRFVINEGPGTVSTEGSYIIDGKELESGDYRVSITAYWDFGIESEVEFTLVVVPSPVPQVSVPVFLLDEGEDFSVDLDEFVKNMEQVGQISYDLVSGPGLLEKRSIYRVPAEEALPGSYRVVFDIRAEDSTVRAETAMRIMPITSEEADTLVVGKSGDEPFDTIQKALDVARDGDTILITSGEYVENIRILNAVNLRGQSKDDVIIRPENPDGACIVVRASGFTLSGITVESPGRGIQFSGSSGVLRDTRVVAGRPGVTFIGSGGSLLIEDSVFSSYDEMNPEKEINSQLVAFHAYGSGKVIVKDSVFQRCGTGILIGNSIEFSILNNLFAGNTIAVSLTSSSMGLFQGNRVTRSHENGLLLNTTAEVTIVENYFYENRLHGLDLYLRMCTICRCGGIVFRGTVLGSGNVFDDPKGICPVEEHDWPEGFYEVDLEIAQRFSHDE